MNMIEDLKKIIKPENVLTSPDDLKAYGKDWTTYFDVKATAVVFPESENEVVQLVKWANLHKTSLVPSGGRTGLSGGACATNNEVVVSFEKMNKILEFNEIDQSVSVQAGVITENLQKFAKSKNLFYPVDFAASGSSQIGGNIATNAGGIKVVRYGLTRDWVIGLKVVTGSGELLSLNQSLIKNASGYDLRHLFIGSEGTLGFITEATIRLTTPPLATKVLILSIPNLESLMKVYSLYKKNLVINAFEMFSEQALQHVLNNNSNLSHPFQIKSPYYVLIEVEIPNETEEEKLLNIFEKSVEQTIVSDGTISQSETQAKTFWKYREDISESLSKHSPYKNDLSVTISKVPSLMQKLDPILKLKYPNWEVVWFGHLGDGNLHINILRPQNLTKEEFVKECQKVDEIVFDVVSELQGSISAEHGVGLTKKPFLSKSRSAAEIELMKSLKKVFDPAGIINPGKIFNL